MNDDRVRATERVATDPLLMHREPVTIRRGGPWIAATICLVAIAALAWMLYSALGW